MLGLVNKWVECRKISGRDSPDVGITVLSWSIEDLNQWLPLFIMEIRKVDGTNFRAKTLFEYILCIQSAFLHLRDLEYAFLNTRVFTPIKNALDNRMRQLQSDGLGFDPNKAQVVTLEMEEALWTSGQLGCQSSATLLNSLVYLLGIHLGLRAGEHRKLRRGMFEVNQ